MQTLADAPAVMSAAQLARFLGVNRKTIYAAAAADEIPSLRIGRRLLFSRDAIVAWLETQSRVALER